MSERTVVHLYDRRARQLVEATLIDGVTREEVERVEGTWKPFLDQQLKRMEAAGVPKNMWPQHRHWDWRLKHGSEFSAVADVAPVNSMSANAGTKNTVFLVNVVNLAVWLRSSFGE